MRNLIIMASFVFASIAQANPQQLPSLKSEQSSITPAVHRTYSVNDDRVYVVMTDSEGNYILTPHEATSQKKDDFIIKPILILQTSK